MGDECDKFYNDLQDTLNDVSTRDMVIIMGDLNARVGQDQHKHKQRQQHETRSGVGPFTVDNLKDDKILSAFRNDLQDIFDATDDTTNSLDEKYEFFVSHIKQTAKHHFPLDRDTNRKRKEWLTDDILKVIDEKSKAFIQWQNNRGTRLESKYHKNYKRLSKTVKSITERRQIEYWDEVCEDIEKSIRNNDPVTAFSIIRRLKGGGKRDNNTPVQDKSGKVLVNPKDTLDRWREFFHETLNVTTSTGQHLIDQIQIPTLSAIEEYRQNMSISIDEVRKALKQMKLRKAPGSDEITADILQAGGEPVIQWLFKFFTEIWENEQMVKEWSMTTLIKLYKNKGDRKICDNYRGIALLNIT
ncbi:unnamed protein product, partial [Rotaria sp. Silwood2]